MKENGLRTPVKGVVCRPLCLLFALFGLSGTVYAQEQIDHSNQASLLSKIIADGNVEQKRDALFQIRNLRSEWASRIAVPALKDRSEIVRATAASSVVFLPAAEGAQVLLPLLNDKAEFVRREAAHALGKTHSGAAAAPLIRTLQKDKIFEVRTAAAVALGEIGDASAVDALNTILRANIKEDDEFLRRSAARSIGQIAQIIKTGNTQVLTPQNLPPEQHKAAADPKPISVVDEFPVFGKSVETLTQVLQNPAESDDTRREAAFSLGAIGDASAAAALMAGTASEDNYLAEISREALLKLNKPQ